MVTTATNPDADPDLKARGDFLNDRSEDATMVTAWVAPGHSATFVLTPEAQRLADKIQPLAEAVLGLRETVRSARSQMQELQSVWCMARGLAAIAAMHFVYNQMRGGQRDGWAATAQQLSDQANALLDKCSKSPAFLMTDGDRCRVSCLPLNGVLRRNLYKQVTDCGHWLKDTDLTQAYDALAKTASYNPNVQLELLIANIVIAEAHELVALAGPLMDPAHSAKKIVDDMGEMLDTLMAKSIDEIKKNPGTETVLDVAIPSWTGLANAANAAGAVTPGFGPDHLLLKIILLYLHRQIPRVVGDPAKAARLREVIIPALHEALGIDKKEAGKEFDKLFEKGEPLHNARAKLAVAKATRGTSPSELELLEKEESVASKAMDREMLELKDEYLGKKLHLHDGPIANTVLTVLAALQIMDAIHSLTEAESGREKAKSAFDIAGGAAAVASSAPAIIVRMKCVDGTAVWLEGTSRIAVRNIGKFVTPAMSILSGAMQVWGGVENGKTSDEVVGGLNMLSGVSFVIYAAVPEVMVWPVVGQTAAFLAFATGLIVGLIEEGTLMTEKYFKSALDTLKKKNWTHGDPRSKNSPGDQGPTAQVLGFQAELDALAATAKALEWWSIPVPADMNKDDIVAGLTFYTGKRDVAERMVQE